MQEDPTGSTRYFRRRILLMAACFVCGFGWMSWWVWNYTPGQQTPTHRSALQSSMRSWKHTSRKVLKLAGSGSNLPLTRVLAQKFALKSGGTIQWKLFQSIGSKGGVQATLDGAIDLGLVSRGLKRSEREQNVKLYPYAKVAVVLATHPGVPIQRLTRQELLQLYAGQKKYWSNGNRVIVLQRERGDSGHRSIAKVIPRFRQVNQQAYHKRRWRVLYRDMAMQQALLQTENSIGVFDMGAIVSQNLPLKMLTFENTRPSLQTMKQGTYPFYKVLSFVSASTPKGLAADFLNFVYSAAGQEQIRRSGYLPIARKQ